MIAARATQSADPSSPADREPRTDSPSPVRGDHQITFEDSGSEFSALHEAEAWLKARGFSAGHLQAGAPIGVMLGCVDIQKWRNLDNEDRADLHGFIKSETMRYRNGSVTAYIRRDAPHDVVEAFNTDPVEGVPQ